MIRSHPIACPPDLESECGCGLGSLRPLDGSRSSVRAGRWTLVRGGARVDVVLSYGQSMTFRYFMKDAAFPQE